jgi:hypothetical protein
MVPPRARSFTVVLGYALPASRPAKPASGRGALLRLDSYASGAKNG